MRSSFWRGLAWISVIVAFLGVSARVLLMQEWVVPDDPKMSAAVAPSLAGGDTILFMKRSKPAFGDLVRCTDPDDPNRYVVGRVAGLHGDTVETNGKELTVNGMHYRSEMACKEDKVRVPHPTSGSTVEIQCEQVQMGGHPHFRGHNPDDGLHLPTKTIVGEGMLYLISDDRTYHDDSRDFGTIPATSCTGRIVFRLWGKEGWKDDQRRLSFIQ
jgi:signal peptidase I